MNEKNIVNRQIGAVRGIDYWEALLAQDPKNLKPLFDAPHEKSERIADFARNVAIINLETSAACNRVCDYCPDALFDRKKQLLLPPDLWARFKDNVRELGFGHQISLNLYNEPMMDPTIFDKISELREASGGVVLKISSNGDFINRKSLERLSEAGLDLAYVTLHAPARSEYRDDRQAGYFRKFFKRCEVAPPSNLEMVPGDRISATFEVGRTKVQVFSKNWGKFGNDRAGTVISLSKIKPRSAPCMRVFREFTISHLGQVFPCCQFFPDAESSQKHSLGSIQDMDLWDIYFSEKAQAWRRSLFDFSYKARPCDTCNDPDNAVQESSNVRQRVLAGFGAR
jgi:hypothetical protein